MLFQKLTPFHHRTQEYHCPRVLPVYLVADSHWWTNHESWFNLGGAERIVAHFVMLSSSLDVGELKENVARHCWLGLGHVTPNTPSLQTATFPPPRVQLRAGSLSTHLAGLNFGVPIVVYFVICSSRWTSEN